MARAFLEGEQYLAGCEQAAHKAALQAMEMDCQPESQNDLVSLQGPSLHSAGMLPAFARALPAFAGPQCRLV